jgi:hypothetical protein
MQLNKRMMNLYADGDSVAIALVVRCQILMTSVSSKWGADGMEL